MIKKLLSGIGNFMDSVRTSERRLIEQNGINRVNRPYRPVRRYMLCNPRTINPRLNGLYWRSRTPFQPRYRHVPRTAHWTSNRNVRYRAEYYGTRRKKLQSRYNVEPPQVTPERASRTAREIATSVRGESDYDTMQVTPAEVAPETVARHTSSSESPVESHSKKSTSHSTSVPSSSVDSSHKEYGDVPKFDSASNAPIEKMRTRYRDGVLYKEYLQAGQWIRGETVKTLKQVQKEQEQVRREKAAEDKMVAAERAESHLLISDWHKDALATRLRLKRSYLQAELNGGSWKDHYFEHLRYMRAKEEAVQPENVSDEGPSDARLERTAESKKRSAEYGVYLEQRLQEMRKESYFPLLQKGVTLEQISFVNQFGTENMQGKYYFDTRGNLVVLAGRRGDMATIYAIRDDADAAPIVLPYADISLLYPKNGEFPPQNVAEKSPLPEPKLPPADMEELASQIKPELLRKIGYNDQQIELASRFLTQMQRGLYYFDMHGNLVIMHSKQGDIRNVWMVGEGQPLFASLTIAELNRYHPRHDYRPPKKEFRVPYEDEDITASLQPQFGPAPDAPEVPIEDQKMTAVVEKQAEIQNSLRTEMLSMVQELQRETPMLQWECSSETIDGRLSMHLSNAFGMDLRIEEAADNALPNELPLSEAQIELAGRVKKQIVEMLSYLKKEDVDAIDMDLIRLAECSDPVIKIEIPTEDTLVYATFDEKKSRIVSYIYHQGHRFNAELTLDPGKITIDPQEFLKNL